MILSITHKELLELKFWIEENSRDGYEAERAKLPLYRDAFGVPDGIDSVLEIGTGPTWGLLPYLGAVRKWGCDLLYPAFEAAGILEERNGVLRVDEPFEMWETNLQFDAIVTTNALDHGEMGFYLLPKIWRMLKPGGRFYCHVHLRPADLLNLVHDHSLTLAQLDQHLSYTDLIEERRTIYSKDVDDGFCQTLVGIWRKPATTGA